MQFHEVVIKICVYKHLPMFIYLLFVKSFQLKDLRPSHQSDY